MPVTLNTQESKTQFMGSLEKPVSQPVIFGMQHGYKIGPGWKFKYPKEC